MNVLPLLWPCVAFTPVNIGYAQLLAAAFKLTRPIYSFIHI